MKFIARESAYRRELIGGSSVTSADRAMIPGGTIQYGYEPMISSLNIKGYRGLENFEMSGLGRINLLVGTNNSGKTSVLEIIHLLASQGDPAAL